MPDAAAPLEDWLDKTETGRGSDHPFPLAALAATRWNAPTRMARCRRCGIGCISCPSLPWAASARMGMPGAAVSCLSVPLPRRMWAGGRLTFRCCRCAKASAQRTTSTIAHIEDKTGRSGRLVFVTVQHRYAVDGETRIEEEHDIVYRDAPPLSARAPEDAQAARRDTLASASGRQDAVAAQRRAPQERGMVAYPASRPGAAVPLFGPDLQQPSHSLRSSYVTGEEGYPGLIVHGPLIATLLVDLLHREQPDARLRAFAFRAMRPCFAGNALTVCGKPQANGEIALWTKDHEGNLGMQATATVA